MTIINLTPHNVTVNGITFEPSGTVARLIEEKVEVGTLSDSEIPVVFKVYSKVEGLPEYSEYLENYYIVSSIVALHLKRADLLYPGDFIRDSDGNITGCRELTLVSVPSYGFRLPRKLNKYEERILSGKFTLSYNPGYGIDEGYYSLDLIENKG
jgi:hypothetical protein